MNIIHRRSILDFLIKISEYSTPFLVDSLSIDEYQLPASEITSKVFARFPENVLLNEDYLYVQPILAPPFRENPFKLEQRQFPIEIPYPLYFQQILILPVPKGYEIEEMPNPLNVNLSGERGEIKYQVSQVNDNLHISFQIHLDQAKCLDNYNLQINQAPSIATLRCSSVV